MASSRSSSSSDGGDEPEGPEDNSGDLSIASSAPETTSVLAADHVDLEPASDNLEEAAATLSEADDPDASTSNAQQAESAADQSKEVQRLESDNVSPSRTATSASPEKASPVPGGSSSSSSPPPPVASTSAVKLEAALSPPLPPKVAMLRRINEKKVDILLELNVELFRVSAAVLAEPRPNSQAEFTNLGQRLSAHCKLLTQMAEKAPTDGKVTASIDLETPRGTADRYGKVEKLYQQLRSLFNAERQIDTPSPAALDSKKRQTMDRGPDEQSPDLKRLRTGPPLPSRSPTGDVRVQLSADDPARRVPTPVVSSAAPAQNLPAAHFAANAASPYNPGSRGPALAPPSQPTVLAQGHSGSFDPRAAVGSSQAGTNAQQPAPERPMSRTAAQPTMSSSWSGAAPLQAGNGAPTPGPPPPQQQQPQQQQQPMPNRTLTPEQTQLLMRMRDSQVEFQRHVSVAQSPQFAALSQPQQMPLRQRLGELQATIQGLGHQMRQAGLLPPGPGPGTSAGPGPTMQVASGPPLSMAQASSPYAAAQARPPSRLGQGSPPMQHSTPTYGSPTPVPQQHGQFFPQANGLGHGPPPSGYGTPFSGPPTSMPNPVLANVAGSGSYGGLTQQPHMINGGPYSGRVGSPAANTPSPVASMGQAGTMRPPTRQSSISMPAATPPPMSADSALPQLQSYLQQQQMQKLLLEKQQRSMQSSIARPPSAGSHFGSTPPPPAAQSAPAAPPPMLMTAPSEYAPDKSTWEATSADQDFDWLLNGE